MKRLLYLFLLTVALLVALSTMVVCTAAQEDRLPPAIRARLHVCLAPDVRESASLTADYARQTSRVGDSMGYNQDRSLECVPDLNPLRISYVLAHYMAFHYSDEAG